MQSRSMTSLPAAEIALAGNPNVGKSTLFNRLTGMHQHTGNWPGKTVALASGIARFHGRRYRFTDLPGTYSLLSHSPEEKIARDHIRLSSPDAILVVLDATAIERGLNLTLQILECATPVLVCVNLLDEAERKGIRVDLARLSALLGVPVIGTVGHHRRTRMLLLAAFERLLAAPIPPPVPVRYSDVLERSIAARSERLSDMLPPPARRGCALQQLLCDDHTDRRQRDRIHDAVVSCLLSRAEEIARECVCCLPSQRSSLDQRLDRIFTGRYTAYPVMLLFLALLFFLTLSVSGKLSQGLSLALGELGKLLSHLLTRLRAPPWLSAPLIEGVYGVLSSVVAVMLPPMAIFFPLFTLLEDLGYLPRIAYNLDRPFCRCNACGKQALTMCMGLGCNAAGVMGCRIIDSERERLLAILTNSLIPCNGRFPALLSLLSAFFIFGLRGVGATLLSAGLLSLLILFSIGATLLVTRLLSKTLLRGVPSVFTLELPPYRRPALGRILLRSLFDRTLYVLGRAAAVAAPMGLVLWLLANLSLGDRSLLSITARAMDPVGRFFGMDGVLLLAFVLGLPANEIVLPIALMIYRSQSQMSAVLSLAEMKQVFLLNGWDSITALCVLLFFLFHWPCSTTLLTVRRETQKLRYPILAALIPTAIGLGLCALVNGVSHLLG